MPAAMLMLSVYVVDVMMTLRGATFTRFMIWDYFTAKG
jgi:hypothetical protein